MITIICATNRPKNQTRKVVDKYAELLKKKGQEVLVFSMEDLPDDFSINETYGKRSDSFDQVLDHYFKQSDKLVIISPEYNGSFPGVFKMFLDAVHPRLFTGKKAALIGVASGRAGNLRGMDHLTDVLHHLQVEVLSYKVPISLLDKLLDEQGRFEHRETIDLLEKQIEKFLRF